MWPFLRKQGKVKKTLTENEIREVLKDNLLMYACRFSEAEGIKKLPDEDIPDLYIKINEKQIAHLHGCSLLKDSKVQIGHFALEKEYVSKGFGEALAHGFSSVLKTAYGTKCIEFVERSYSPAHEKLFKKLGAVPRDNHLCPGKPDWIWILN